MDSDKIRNFKAATLLTLRFSWRKKGLWLRAILCWLIGTVIIAADHDFDYDLRMKIRGDQPVDRNIILLIITHTDWEKWFGEKSENLSFLKESNYFKDSYYWEPKAWQTLLEQLLKENPLAIGMSPYFGENIPRPNIKLKRSKIFTDPKIIWSAQIDDEGHILPSRFAKSYSKNTGLNEYLVDRDGIVRRFGYTTEQIPHFAIQLARHIEKFKNYDWGQITETPKIINYHGGPGTYNQINIIDFFKKNYPVNYFTNKIVIIGTLDEEGVEFLTPLGRMSRAEIVANLIDNIKNNQWIRRPSLPLTSLLILLFVLFVAWVTSNYPQFLAFFFVTMVNIFFMTFSIWMFDTHYIWVPIIAPAVTSFITYFMFLSFQLTLKEYLNTQLEKEHKFLNEMEELKNNFLSLISHDLKTPIAKIQAICDRLLTQYADKEISPDLISLREVATELHRYIQTILQITRVESRDFRIKKDASDINEIIEAVAQQLEPLAKHKKIHLTTTLEPMFLIEIDHVLIHEVILNLVENAIKYSPENGTVDISSREVDNQVLVMVEDNGPGISVEEQARIFEKFYRGELGKSQPKGSGLGLYLVKYFVELHDGKVFLDSSKQSGTRIGFSLPIGAENESLTTEDKSSGE